MVSGEYPPMKGGVSRYTHSLVEALRKKVEVLVVTNMSKATDSSSNTIEKMIVHGDELKNLTIFPILRKGDKENSDRLLTLVDKLKPDIVNVQYERGLYEIDTPLNMLKNTLFGTTLDKFYKFSTVPTISTIHTVYPYNEYREYIRQRASRKAGKLNFLPRPLRLAIRSQIMEQRYRLLMRIVKLSNEVISPAKTVYNIVKRGTVIYHGAEPVISSSSSCISTASLETYDKNEFRKEFGLPADKMLLLAFGYAGFYKGFDILDNLSLPKDWKIVIKQNQHERGAEQPIQINNAINLNLGYIDDSILSKLFLSCNAIIFPYKLVSVSGVLFDALAHGLPFVASDLEFFREFAEMGLGVVSKRDAVAFSKSLQYLADNYCQYRKNAESFSPNIRWSNIAERHIEFFLSNISKHTKMASTL